MKKQTMFRALGLLLIALSLVAFTSPAWAKQEAAAPANRLSATAAPAIDGGVIRALPPRLPETLINDGSFENGPPPTSAWTEVTNSACEWIGDWSGAWGAGAYDGSLDFWAGGYCGGVATSSSVSQAGIPVPATDNNLHFWYMSYRPDPDDPVNDDFAYVRVNGTIMWTLPLTVANDTFPSWVEVVLPLAAYASQNVTLQFEAVSGGAATGNIRYDFIQIGEPPPPPPRCPDGYEEITVLSTEGFEGSFPPAGWTVSNSTSGCGNGYPGWNNSDPGARGNLTGASGLFAIADSDNCGSSVSMNAEIWTPPIDLTNLVAPEVAFNLDYYRLGDTATLDLSTNGGSSWSNIYTWTGSARGPRSFSAPFAGDGQAGAIVRWHYVSGWDWWWQIDDVTVTACQPTGGVEPGPTVLEIPTLSKAGFALLGLLLAGAAFLLLRRR